MKKLKIAILSFPGNNCEVESLRSIKRCGMEAVFFKWNGSHKKLSDVDGYFIPGGFSYEDRGRAGMVAARDPLLAFLFEEAEKGKVIIGNCNGAQVLVESGLIPLNKGLRMSLARNVVDNEAVGFLNEWIWITPTCARDRCATSDWEGAMQLPIAHGEGRFVTKDKDVIEELKRNDQIAFSYCDSEGNVSDEAPICPNGSMFGAAGICNKEGNVVALMPHPERTIAGDPYFISMKNWIEEKRSITRASLFTVSTDELRPADEENKSNLNGMKLTDLEKRDVEIFIDTIIVNNEERTVEQAAKRIASDIKIKQSKYFSSKEMEPQQVLSILSLFNPNKEIAYIKRGQKVTKWNPDKKKEEVTQSPLEKGITIIRRDVPDTGAGILGKGAISGICYVLGNIKEQDLYTIKLLEVFSNPHSSTLSILR
ncbi:phosphoribosylformylglycinamidine synthase I [Patescibacteria group bacterium]|nr:phosphoribosylformylglycinamidine synthase I [Patescibacteria group bacterium]